MIFEEFEDQLKKEILANGYIITGGFSKERLFSFLAKLGEVHFPPENIGIDEVREIKEKSAAALKNASSRLFFVLDADKMHRLAFPALLKLVEEPLTNRHFFIMARHSGRVPATVRSRLVEVLGGEERLLDDAKKFAALSFSERSKAIEEIAEDSGKFGFFLDSLENYAREKSNPAFLGRLEKAREASLVLNVGRKMCLEYLAPFLNF